MAKGDTVTQTSLQAKSPFELRVNLGKTVPEVDVRTALATGDMGFLHSFTTGSTVDGPGVRVVAWTTGCMWRCVYCHNPDTWTMSNGIPVSIAKAAQELRRYRHGLKVMSGGFTLSGGEPLMQHRFAIKLLTTAKDMGIHTALDTNGYYSERLADGELDAIDLVLLDIKAWDRERHRRITGMDLEPTLAVARRLAARKHPIWFRAGARGERQPGGHRADRRVRGRSRERRTRRRIAGSPDGSVQVEAARPGVHARRGRAAVECSRRADVCGISGGGPEGLLKYWKLDNSQLPTPKHSQTVD